MVRICQFNRLHVLRISEEGDEIQRFLKRIVRKLDDQLTELYFNPGTTPTPDLVTKIHRFCNNLRIIGLYDRDVQDFAELIY